MGNKYEHIINSYEACPQCGRTDMLEVQNYDPVWRNGQVWCRRCNMYVRGYDAGWIVVDRLVPILALLGLIGATRAFEWFFIR